MRACKKSRPVRKGFTLAEILTTLAVVAVLLSLLIPALNTVRKKAQVVKQQAQFHGIEVGLEAFRADWGDYPPSEYPGDFDVEKGSGFSAPCTCASQRLAEALIGRDGLGFHQSSEFRALGLADVNGDGILDPVPNAAPGIYNAASGVTLSGSGGVQTVEQNLAARKGPYLEVETANAVMFSKYYAPDRIDDTYVLADAFPKKMKRSGVELGMPILYYRANPGRIGNDPAYGNWGTNTYNLNDSYCDSQGIIVRPVPFQSTSTSHPLSQAGSNASAANLFYSRILNPNFTSPPRPYRANSFLLQSAGPDGLYGTPDDIFNF